LFVTLGDGLHDRVQPLVDIGDVVVVIADGGEAELTEEGTGGKRGTEKEGGAFQREPSLFLRDIDVGDKATSEGVFVPDSAFKNRVLWGRGVLSAVGELVEE